MTTETNPVLDIIARNSEIISATAEALTKGNVIESHGWVVVLPHTGCVKFDLTEIRIGRKTRFKASNPVQAGPAYKANRYTEQDARILAADTKNGSGEYAVAMHWTDAAREELVKLREVNELFSAYL